MKNLCFAILCFSLFFLDTKPGITASAVEKQYVSGAEYAGSVDMPHRWGVNFVKKGNYLFCTGVESARKFYVIDVSDPKKMKVVSETNGGMYALRNLCVNDDIALVNSYRSLVPIDISDPKDVKEINGCEWQVDQDEVRLPPFYRQQWIGNRLYVACARPEIGFRVYETSRTFMPSLKGTVDITPFIDKSAAEIMNISVNWYPNAEMIVDGDIVHTSYGSVMMGFDISDPAAPKILYSMKMEQNIVGLTLSGRNMFVAMNRGLTGAWSKLPDIAYVAVVSLENPRAPRFIGGYRGMAMPDRMLAHGDVMYLVGREKTPEQDKNINGIRFTKGMEDKHSLRMAMHVLDISNPAEPVKTGSIHFPFNIPYEAYVEQTCRDMTLDGNILYVADQEFGVRAVDVSSPSSPKEIGSIRTVTHEIRWLIPVNDLLYVVNDNCINALNIKDPVHPEIENANGSIAEFSRFGMSRPKFGQDNRYLYCLNSGCYEIAIVDFGTPPAAEGKIVNLVPAPAGWGLRDLGWSKGRLYVLGTKENKWATGCLFVYKPLDNGKNLELMNTYPLGTFKEWIGWLGGTSFNVAGDRIFIINAPWKDRKNTSIDLITVDISKPDSLKVYPIVDLIQHTPGFVPSGLNTVYKNGYLYLYALEGEDASSGQSILLVYDMRNPADPLLAGSLRDPVLSRPIYHGRQLILMDPLPYLALVSEGTGAWIVDISNPLAPVTAWKEFITMRNGDWESYDYIAKPGPAYQNGFLYVPRLDKVDIYKLAFKDGTRPSGTTRTAAIKSAQASILKAKDNAQLPAALRGELQAMEREIEYYLTAGDLQQAETFAAGAERLFSNPAGFTLPSQAFHVPHTTGAITIDGKTDEWGNVPWTRFEKGDARVKWQWDEQNLYILIEASDPIQEKTFGGLFGPHSYMGDHVDIFLTPVPASSERAYGPDDVQYSIDLSGDIVYHNQNTRLRGEPLIWGSTQAKTGKTVTTASADKYVMEIALPHETTWLYPSAGTVAACSIIVIDRGDRPKLLSDSRIYGYQAVQPSWPILVFEP